ncbi:MAG TPA: hypothetical protein VM716_15235 [Gemmatimonadales bacterium]|nr:hypothetical protein [Gemmatimonadales bacterium]
MGDALSRRDWLKAVGASGAGALAAPLVSPGRARGVGAAQILPLTSTSEVFIPPRGRAFQKFSFDFPEPSVEFAGLRFGFLLFSRENVYGLDASRMTAVADGDRLEITAGGLVWAGGQERASGRVSARLRRDADAVVWDVTADLDQPIKAVTTVLRGVPRGKLWSGGREPFDPTDDEVLWGYPFGGGDLFGENAAQGMGTPLAVVQQNENAFLALSSLDDRVRTKRFYFQPGEQGYRVELVHEVEGWLDQRVVQVPAWRVGGATSLEAAVAPHYAHLEQVYRFPRWEARTDVPAWLRSIQLVVTLHGMHFTGYIFNHFARMLEILRWIATQIPPERVLAFVSAWDGRYYWDYPTYEAASRLGGEAGFRRLVQEAHMLGFKIMPMFGANAANRRLANFARFADAATARVDGDAFDLDWVDWDNDRHQEGFGVYMNLGVESWRRWLTGRIADVIDRYGVDAYFLDIIGGWVNNTKADMHEGARRLVADLRARYPRVLACGEFLYDALLEFIPLYHVYTPRGVPYARFFSHLSHPAPGRGSSGVHESGFSRWDAATLSLSRREGLIPTLNVVDDTFTKYRDQMAAVIAQAKAWTSP